MSISDQILGYGPVDNQKAKELLKWSPKNSGEAGLRRGLTQTIEWFRKRENLKKYPSDHYVV